jgi:hypothetical protein
VNFLSSAPAVLLRSANKAGAFFHFFCFPGVFLPFLQRLQDKDATISEASSKSFDDTGDPFGLLQQQPARC